MGSLARCLLLVSLFITPIFPANWYVRPNGGSYGAEDGSDWANAFDGFSDINWAGTACGDTIWVAGGTYTQSLQLQKKCTAGNELAVRRARSDAAACTSATGWSAGFDSTIAQNDVSMVINGDRDYIIVSGRTTAAGGTHGWHVDFRGQTEGTGIDFIDGSDADFNFFEYLELEGPGTITYTSDGRGIDMTPFASPTITSNNTFSHLKIHGWESAVYNVFADNSVFEYLEVYDINAINSATFHPNGIFIHSADGGIVRHSVFRRETSGTGEGIFFEQSGGASDWHIYGNLFIDLDESFLKAIQITSAVPGILNYNNTFINTDNTVFVNLGSCGAGSATRNNIMYLSGGPSTCGTTDNNTDDDTDRFVDAAGGDYHLAEALAGVCLSSPFNVDPDGVTRGSGDGVCDRGAFDFNSGADATPPTPGNSGTLGFTAGETTMAVTFTKATDAESAQTALVYRLYRSSTNNIGTVANAELNGTLADTDMDVAQLDATGLSEQTLYWFNVIVEDEAGNKAAYTQASQRTDCDPCTWYVSAAGNDANDGLSSATPFETLAPLDTEPSAGDTARLNGGDIWRESLALSANVTIDCYGTCDPEDPDTWPSIRGSNTRNLTGDWTEISTNVWCTGSIAADPIVFAHDELAGNRKASPGALASNWDYAYDSGNTRLCVFQSAGNPASQAALLEYAARNRILDDFSGVSATYRHLDIRHTTGDLAWGAFSASTTTFEKVRCSQVAGYCFQFSNGSQGSFSELTCRDWGFRDGSDYCVQVIGFEATPSGPLDVDDSTFEITAALAFRANTDHMAINQDSGGWLRFARRNTITGTKGEGILVWRSSAAATQTLIEGNTLANIRGLGIVLQELDTNSPSMSVIVRLNRLTNGNLDDVLDEGAIRLRGIAADQAVEVYSNIVDGTLDGANAHPCIEVEDTAGAKIWNNTLRLCTDGLELKTASGGNSGLELLNNIFDAMRRYGINGAAASFAARDHNLVWASGTADFNGAGMSAAANDVLADPLFANPGAGNFELQDGSPAIDAGTDVGLTTDFAGVAIVGPDIGAFEGQQPSGLPPGATVGNVGISGNGGRQ